MEINYYQVNAFTNNHFSGNPAGVVRTNNWLSDNEMQDIAKENDLSETAFIVGSSGAYTIRYFTPTTEIDICGHATLASAHVIFTEIEKPSTQIRFQAPKTEILVHKNGEDIVMGLPQFSYELCPVPNQIQEAFEVIPLECYQSESYFIIYPDEKTVKEANPDKSLLQRLPGSGVAISAPGESCDFVLRFFAPSIGIPEDPATGVANAILTPYWAKRLNKPELVSKQLSERGGDFHCVNLKSVVRISGQAKTYLKGLIQL